MNHKVKFLTHGALIAALYIVLTYLAQLLGLASGVIQLRLSEVLCILPYFTPAAIPGLFLGCLLANLLTGSVLWDVIFGSLATLIGAVFAYLLRRHRWLVPLPTILANIIVVPLVLRFVYAAEGTLPFFILTVGVGEILSCGVLGMLLLRALKKYEHTLFS